MSFRREYSAPPAGELRRAQKKPFGGICVTRRCSATHFRRQVPIGRYVADFACLATRLVIEIDGSQHAEGPVAEADQDANPMA